MNLVGIVFFLVHLGENSFVKTPFGVKFQGRNEIFGGNPNIPPGNGYRINTVRGNILSLSDSVTFTSTEIIDIIGLYLISLTCKNIHCMRR